MQKLIAEVWRHPRGSLSTILYCNGDDEQLNHAITHTLLSLIQESVPPSDVGLEALVAEAEAGCYVPRDASIPDWGVNDKNVWLVAPMAKLGHICISNENIDKYSTEEGGHPQIFTYRQFRAALSHWRKFLELIASEGKEKLAGRRFEDILPD